MSTEPGAVKASRSRRWLPWAAPLVVAGVIAGGTIALSSGASGAVPDLAPRTPAQLLTAMRSSGATALSGDISEAANLGIPTLPGAKSSASLSWQTFVTGTHEARVWADGASKQRVALLGELSEADVVHNGKDLWTYTSQTNTVSHTVLAAKDRKTDRAADGAVPMTPAQQTTKILAAITPSTKVTLGANRMVAGRSAYTLVIAPRDASSTVRQITVAVDSAKFVPLQVQVFGASSSAALSVGFSTISFATPVASTFAFKIPAGASVTTNPLLGQRGGYARAGSFRHDGGPMPTHHRKSGWVAGAKARASAPSTGWTFYQPAGPRVIGEGWTAVVELRDGMSLGGALDGQLDNLTTSVGTSGDRLLTTALVNAVITSDGRVFAGAVAPKTLEHIADTTPN